MSGCHGDSAFRSDFERELGHAFVRHYRLVRIERRPVFLLTFANHPAWASLNQGHNFQYLFPLDPTRTTPLTPALVEAIRADVFSAGCTPYSVMHIGGADAPWVDLQLRPEAMELAARAAEAF